MVLLPRVYYALFPTVRIHRILLTHLSRTTIRVWRVLNTRAAASGPSACPPASGLERLDHPERAALATELPRAICERFDEKVVAAALDRVSLVLYYASTLSPAGALDKLMERFDIALLHCNWISLVFVRLHPFNLVWFLSARSRAHYVSPCLLSALSLHVVC
jgi:hypothetical protein